MVRNYRISQGSNSQKHLIYGVAMIVFCSQFLLLQLAPSFHLVSGLVLGARHRMTVDINVDIAFE
jgi:hypothetical protein